MFSRGGWKKYFFNRILRIYPLIIFTSMLQLVIECAYSFHMTEFSLISLAKSLVRFFVEIVFPGATGLGVGNGSLWSVRVELQFYILIPVVYRFLKNRKKLIWIIFICISMLFSLLDNIILQVVNRVELLGKIYSLLCLPYLYIFLIGAFCYNFREEIVPFCIKTKNLLFMIICYVIFYFLYYSVKIIPEFGKTYNPIICILLTFVIIGIGYKYHLQLKYDLSYGLYIWHMIFVNIILKILPGGGYVEFLIIWIVTIIISFITYRYIEQTCLLLKQKN